MTVPLALYRGASALASPLLRLHLRRRAGRGKEDRTRLGERLGTSPMHRPDGPLLWVHAASVGESLSALPLIDALSEAHPEIAVLMTTGTVTSAQLIVARAPDVIHQYAPLDIPAAVERFLNHWRPDLALWMESEIWPNLLSATTKRGIASALVNGRLSKTSARNWSKAPATAKSLMSAFDVRLVQSDAVQRRLLDLGAPAETTHVTGDLKASRNADEPDAAALAVLRATIGSRPVWLAASTHPGEEEAVLAAHDAIAARAPDLLTIIAPRHPERGGEIAALAHARGHTATRRSAGEGPSASIYIADTLGEMPLWYALAPITYVGAGWDELGGHNPLEPVQAGAAVLSGPKVANFEQAYADLTAADAVRMVADGEALTDALLDLLDGAGHPTDAAKAMAKAGAIAGAPDPAPLQATLTHLAPLIARAFP